MINTNTLRERKTYAAAVYENRFFRACDSYRILNEKGYFTDLTFQGAKGDGQLVLYNYTRVIRQHGLFSAVNFLSTNSEQEFRLLHRNAFHLANGFFFFFLKI